MTFALLCCSVLSSCVGEPDELFPALPITAPADTESPEPASPPAPAPVAPVETAGMDLPAPPIALDVGAESPNAGEGAESPPSEGDPDEPTAELTPPPVGVPGDDAPPLAGEAPAGEAPAGEVPAPPAGDEGAPEARLCARVDDALLLDFADPVSAQQALFGDFEGVLSGGTYVYPEALAAGAGAVPPPGLLSDVTAGDWHISGSVTQQSGFGLFLDCQLLDASRFAGLAFRISGRLEGRDSVTLLVGSAANEVSGDWRQANDGTSEPSFGRCAPARNEFDGTCQQARVEIAVPAASREVFVPFSALSGGSPEPGVDPSEITSIGWALPNAGVTASGGVEPFAVDLRIDDIRFVETPPAAGARAPRPGR